MSPARDEIYTIGPAPDVDVKNLLVEMLLREDIETVYLQEGFSEEQIYICGLLSQMGVQIPAADVSSIFVGEKGYREVTVNYDKIIPTKSDMLFAADNSLTETQLKKLMLLKAIAAIRGRYGREGRSNG
jgi:hypothetical protein